MGEVKTFVSAYLETLYKMLFMPLRMAQDCTVLKDACKHIMSLGLVMEDKPIIILDFHVSRMINTCHGRLEN